MDTVNYGTIRCKVCMHSFEPDIKKHYIARDAGKVGFGAAFSSNDEPKQYDAFDCPRCGCQCRLQERVRTVEPVTPPDAEETLDLMDKAIIDNYLGLKDGAAEALRQAKIKEKPIVIIANGPAVDESLIFGCMA